MSRGHGAAQRFILEHLPDDGQWVRLDHLAKLWAAEHPDTMVLFDRERGFTESQRESLRRAIAKLVDEGLVERHPHSFFLIVRRVESKA